MAGVALSEVVDDWAPTSSVNKAAGSRHKRSCKSLCRRMCKRNKMCKRRCKRRCRNGKREFGYYAVAGPLHESKAALSTCQQAMLIYVHAAYVVIHHTRFSVNSVHRFHAERDPPQ